MVKELIRHRWLPYIILALLVGFQISCSDDDDNGNTTFESEGKITGADLRECVCQCGGYFIEIGEETYRFEPDELPDNNLDLSADNMPVEVELNWELKQADSDCSASDRIIISDIARK